MGLTRQTTESGGNECDPQEIAKWAAELVEIAHLHGPYNRWASSVSRQKFMGPTIIVKWSVKLLGQHIHIHNINGPIVRGIWLTRVKWASDSVGLVGVPFCKAHLISGP